MPYNYVKLDHQFDVDGAAEADSLFALGFVRMDDQIEWLQNSLI
jgi:hypothetical protein